MGQNYWQTKDIGKVIVVARNESGHNLSDLGFSKQKHYLAYKTYAIFEPSACCRCIGDTATCICRREKSTESGEAVGVPGKVKLLLEEEISEQPISGFSWNAEKRGLYSCVALDQCLRIGIVTNLHLV